MGVYFLILALAVISLVTFLFYRVKKDFFKSLGLKAATSFLFVVCACLCAFIQPENTFNCSWMLIVFGLLCALFGDVWLDLKVMHPKFKDNYLFYGMGTFTLSHFFFVPALIVIKKFTALQYLIAVACAFAFAIGVMIFEKPMKFTFGKFKKIVFVYSVFLALTASLSTIFCISSAFSLRALFMAIGSLSILASDLILSGTYFGVGKDRNVDIISNHVLYYVGQFFIASSLMFSIK